MSSSRPGLLIYGGAAGLLVVFALAAGLLAGAEFAIPVVILGVLVVGFLMLNGLLARRSNRNPDAKSDAGDSVPAAHVITDDRPLGDTAEAHDEISPHDLPRDAPGRRAAQAQAARRGGTTRGHTEGAAGGRVLEQEDLDTGDGR